MKGDAYFYGQRLAFTLHALQLRANDLRIIRPYQSTGSFFLLFLSEFVEFNLNLMACTAFLLLNAGLSQPPVFLFSNAPWTCFFYLGSYGFDPGQQPSWKTGMAETKCSMGGLPCYLLAVTPVLFPKPSQPVMLSPPQHECLQWPAHTHSARCASHHFYW